MKRYNVCLKNVPGAAAVLLTAVFMTAGPCEMYAIQDSVKARPYDADPEKGDARTLESTRQEPSQDTADEPQQDRVKRKSMADYFSIHPGKVKER